ncbi:MAG: ABC transporter ATP-binding protein [Anaerolineae bacterium]|nr:ABC transporter ATP-binding protein [Anaerolineae bacterium]
MPDQVVTVHDFTKRYGDFTAVDSVSFEVHKGDVFGLLGPNGAGKTTTLECLEGLRKPDGGTLRVMGVDPTRDPHRLRNLIGVQLQTSGMPDNITVREAMNLFSAYHGSAPRFDLLERVGLEGKLATQYVALSTGQKRRLQLALAVTHQPQVVILDEPTAGLDVQSRVELHKLIGELQAQGVTIILSSHDMAEVEKLSNRIAILLQGRIVAQGSPRELTAHGAGLTKISIQTERATVSELTALPGVTQRSARDGYDIYFTTDTAATVLTLLEHLKAQGDTLIDLRVERPSLEERFLEITGGKEVVS